MVRGLSLWLRYLLKLSLLISNKGINRVVITFCFNIMCFFQHRRHYRMLWIFQDLKIEQCSLDGVSLVLICLNCLIAVRILETWKNVLNKEKNQLVERNTQKRCHVTRDIVQYAFENDRVHSYVKERWLLQSYSTSSDKVIKFGVKIYHRNSHIVLN